MLLCNSSWILRTLCNYEEAVSIARERMCLLLTAEGLIKDDLKQHDAVMRRWRQWQSVSG